MDIVKKNILSIICGVVIILAIVALFWPISGMYEEFQQKLEARKEVYQEAEQLKTKPRNWPVVELGPDAQPKPLEQFPSEAVIEEGKEVTELIAAQSTQMKQAALAMNRHAPLIERALPDPSNQSAFDFRAAYGRHVNEVLPKEILQATAPPGQADIEEARTKIWEEKFKTRIVYRTEQDEEGKPQTIPLNEEQVTADFEREMEDLPERIQRERAANFQAYLDPGALTVSQEVANEGPAPSATQIWYAQNALWVQEDIARAIARVNAGAKGIKNSPVKHILRLAVPTDETQYVRPNSGADAGAAAMPYGGGYDTSADTGAAVADPNAPLPKDFKTSPTGRVSNPLYDVVRWDTELIVDAARIPDLLEELSKEHYFSVEGEAGRSTSAFMTPTSVTITPVDAQSALAQGYVYGDKPVVKLALQGEALLLREWTSRLMPTRIRQDLGVEPKPTEGTDGSTIGYAQ